MAGWSVSSVSFPVSALPRVAGGLKLFVISKVGMAQDGRRWSIRALGLSAQVVEGLVNIKRENQPRHRRGGG